MVDVIRLRSGTVVTARQQMQVNRYMHILLDASVFEAPQTGIARVTAGLATACLASDPGLSITALHRRALSQNLPPALVSRRLGSWLPHSAWRSIVLPLVADRRSIMWFPWNGNVPALPAHVTVLTTLHDVLPLLIPGHFASLRAEAAYRRRIQRDIDRTHLLFTDSEYSRNQILANFTLRNEPVVLRFGSTVDPSQHRTSPPPADEPPYFLYVGGYDKRKGIEQLLRVCIGLHQERRTNARLVLTGSKRYYSDTFRNLIETGRAMGIVEERGYVDDATLVTLLRHARALVYPSTYEGFGLPPLEAMTVGCPVITVHETSLPEICGEAALYVDPNDTPSFGTLLLEVERNEALREDLRRKGLRRAATFSWESAAGTFLDAIRSALQRRSDT